MRRGGFSLVEISIVLVVISVMISGVLPYITESQKTNAANDTAERLEAIELAMLTFRADKGFIPCPSDITAALNGSNFGAATTTADCHDGTAPDPNFGDTADFAGTGFTVAGGVPTRALGLSDEYGFDGWGRRLVYHVDTRLTVASTYSSASGGSIRVNDATGTARTMDAAYAVVSHGPNGHGAYTRAGTRFSFGTTLPNEQENCDCNASAVATTYDTILVQSMAIPNTDPLAAFDDIVRYQIKPSLELLVGGGGGAATSPSFRVHKNGTNQTVASSTLTLLTWSTEAFDTNNNFAANRFTPTVAGKYLFTLGAGNTSTTPGDYVAVAIYKNGVQAALSDVIAYSASQGMWPALSTVLDMNGTTDYVEAYVTTYGTSVTGAQGSTNFSGSLLK